MTELKELPKGVAPIKREFIIKFFDNEDERDNDNDNSEEPEEVNDDSRKRKYKEQKRERNKKVKGMNKGRNVAHVKDDFDICNRFLHGTCTNGDNCKWGHNIEEYLKRKPKDLGNVCPNYEKYQSCPYGIKCRYYSGHKTEAIERPEGVESETINVIGGNVQKLLRKKSIAFEKTKMFEKLNNEFIKEHDRYKVSLEKETKTDVLATTEENNNAKAENDNSTKDEKDNVNNNSSEVDKSSQTDEVNEKSEISEANLSKADIHEIHEKKLQKFDQDTFEAKLRPQEKKIIDFRGKTYCAPLTTVGNLPFRRIIKGYGCDITCGEMAVANKILEGQKNEWALVRRHKCEDIFGVQLTGANPQAMASAGEILCKETNIDFIDLNIGCPIDTIFKAGAGSALMVKQNKLREAVQGLNYATTCPITVKLRTGIYKNKNIAHKLLKKFDSWGVQLATVHGRSREQRYTKLADYDYIKTCADSIKGGQMTLFGNGDIFSWEDYYKKMEYTGVSGIMIGRGALIKPWIFKEIKERQHYDIQATERLEIMNDFCRFGLEHWGSDTVGVNTTRRYLCDWQSFLHRYIPVGILEVLPQKLNDRPPVYFARNELETLMASPKANDWIKLTEKTILGPAPESFTFIPKHKANAYEG